MEEDIKFIKYYMKQYFYEDISIEDDFKFEEAIKNLLTRYKEAVDENMKLKENRIEIETKARNYDKMQVEMEQIVKENMDLKIAYKLMEDETLKEIENCIPKSKVKEIRDKAEVMDYYTLPDVIEDLNKLLEE